ncbi:PREDICTED: protein PIN-LIKES 3-like isoform X2 [Nelumbo nucifera]|uniref:Protein PIN-LIKES 3-like isoform X2 n=1 Tax=Nelumbo nucifera TaxID=4432 RepID=A0A1U8Q7Y6_NELNU|nr:PREDICTED: protein PIN-LIKES 3-like isoform X2 [Nelumbo nucifera]
MGLLDLFITASMPVLKVLLVTLIGSLLALDQIDILGEDARKHLNQIVYFVFTPALVGSYLAKTITLERMAMLWFMPVNILITYIIGSILGWIVIRITRPPSHLKGLILGCCSAGNMGNMFIIFIPAVCKEKGNPFGAHEICHTYGLAYASLSMAIGAVYLWAYVYNLVRVSSCTSSVQVNGSTICSKLSGETSEYKGSCTEALLNSQDCSISSDFSDQYKLPCIEPQGELKFVGFLVGIVPQMRRSVIGENAPLRVIQDSASLVGDGAVPALTLIMGGNLMKGLQGSQIKLSLIFGIIIVRYITLPLLGILIIKGAIRYGLVHSDPLYQFVLLLQFAVPPAMNIGTITQLFGTGERECSVIMLWTYILASVSITLWSTFFMWLLA